MNKKSKMPEFRVISKTKSMIYKLKKKIKTQKLDDEYNGLMANKIVIPIESYKKLLEVFKNESALGIISPSEKKNRLVVWYETFHKTPSMETAFICTEAESEFINSCHMGDLETALLVFYKNDKSKVEEKMKYLRTFDCKKKEAGLI